MVLVGLHVASFLFSGQYYSRLSLACQFHPQAGTVEAIAPAVTSAADIDPVFSTEELLVGTAVAFALAFLVAFLDSRKEDAVFLDGMKNSTATNGEQVLFDGWDQMKRPENYILYKTRLRRGKQPAEGEKEQKWVVAALLALFVPIFSFELFLTTSRQVLCGPLLTGGGDPSLEWARHLCSPSYIPPGS